MKASPLRLLLVEDSEDDAQLILRELRKSGYDAVLERVETAAGFVSALDRELWDLVISDYRMPCFSGLEALRLLRSRGHDLPFILVSGAVGEDQAVEAMKAGAHDWIMKDRLARLVPAIRRELGEAEVRRKRREAEEALRAAYAELERRVEERTAQLSEANLRLREELQERKRAEEERNRMFVRLLRGQKLQAIGQLAAGVAHEINNPVGWILSNLGTLESYSARMERLLGETAGSIQELDGPDAARLKERFERLRAEVDADFMLKDFSQAIKESRDGAIRIRDIVASLKVYAHPDQREPEEAHLSEIIRNALRLCSGELKYKAEVDLELATLEKLSCRPREIEQVLINLLVNAAQAIPDRGTITVSSALEGGQAVVRVRDTGKGIAPDHQKRLFEPFFTTKPVGKGTGLGLHVAFKIVRAHGGTIEVASKLGKGTEVTIRLPLRRSAPAVEEKEGQRRKRPLVVLLDDDPTSLRVLRRALSREPVSLLSTVKPRKALEWVSTRDVRLVLSDQRMPEMQGTSFLGEVERLSPATRRVLVTAYPDSPEVEEARGKAVEGILAKPWDERELSRTMREFLGMAVGGAE